MDFNNAQKMTRMGVHMTRTEWQNPDLVLTIPNETLVVIRSLTDPLVELSPSNEDFSALDWEVKRSE